LVFSTAPDSQISFQLLVDGYNEPSQVFIGNELLQPADSNFTIRGAVPDSVAMYDLETVYHSSIGHYMPFDFYAVDLALDPEGNLYLLDAFRERLRKFDAEGRLVFEFDYIGEGFHRGIDLNDRGDIFIATHGSRRNTNRIYRYGPKGELIADWGTSGDAELETPNAVAIDNQGRVLVCDMNGISAYMQDGTFLWKTTLPKCPPGIKCRLRDLAVGPDNSIYVADGTNHRIVRLNENSEYLLEWKTEIKNPVAVAVSRQGEVIVHCRNQSYEQVGLDQIYKYTAGGELIKSWGAKGADRCELWEAHGITLGNENTLWVAGYHGHNILRYDLDGNLLDCHGGGEATPSGIAEVFGVAVDSQGNTFVVDKWNQVIQKFDRFGNFLIMWGRRGQGNGPVFNFPRYAHTDANDNLYICDDGWIRIFKGNGTFLERIPIHFDFPGGMSTDTAGNLWVAERGNSRVLKLNNLRQVEYILPSGDQAGEFSRPRGVWVDNDDSAFIADLLNYRVQKISSFGKFLTMWETTGAASGIFGDLQGRIYISDIVSDAIQVFSKTGRFLDEWSVRGRDPKRFHNVVQIAMDGHYFMYAPDFPENRNLEIGRVHKYALVPDFDVYGKPDFRAGKELGYFIWKDNGGWWHLQWSGDGDLHQFAGTLHSTTPIVDFKPVSVESNDTISAEVNRIDFSGAAGQGMDGFNFKVEPEAILTFDLRLDGAQDPSVVRVGWNHRQPVSLPLPLENN
jgi:sugar lactone lactonase YvrE